MSHTNLLNHETSPYLLQHADNPVHWQAWNRISLEQASSENKPILLSIGYSACHWCHVMAHESFEDESTAQLMNDFFINIKVDKEERPDLDRIYQLAHSMLTERTGGWPLTVFLTPDKHMPIFAGTYFPREPRHGLPSFQQLLHYIHEVWLNRQNDIQQQCLSLYDAFKHLNQPLTTSPDILSTLPVDVVRNQIEMQFDSRHGGFSPAPKFPHPAIIERTLLHWAQAEHHQQPDPRILHTAIYSLEKMANGGIFDHLGGGFCRYSTDNDWMIPHFEKMLYDNGPLLALYAQAWCITGSRLFYHTAKATANWVLDEMQSTEGGYYSAQDADTEGIEGKYYAWDKEEIRAVIDNTYWPTFKYRYGLDKAANFENKWHLHACLDETSIASKLNLDIETVYNYLEQAEQQLFKQRNKRIHPARDEKILIAWNGLMIRGMAIAGNQLNKNRYIESAIQSAFFIKNHCWVNQHLFASYKDGRAQLNAYLDDYAFLLQGLLELLQAKWDNTLYAWALELADTLIHQFEDTDNGGFYFTSHDHEPLIQRIKSFADDAIPSGNAIACLALNRLACLSGRTQYIHSVERCLQAAWPAMNQAPVSHCAMISALNEFFNPPATLVIRSLTEDYNWYSRLPSSPYMPQTMVFNIPADQPVHPDLESKTPQPTTCAYPCQGQQCYERIDSSEEIEHFMLNNSYRISE